MTELEETPPADYDDGDVEEVEVNINQDILDADLDAYRYPNGDLIDIHETPPSQ